MIWDDSFLDLKIPSWMEEELLKPEEESEELSSYEQVRQANIDRNQQKLKELMGGTLKSLGKPILKQPAIPRTKKKRNFNLVSQRKSSRITGMSQSKLYQSVLEEDMDEIKRILETSDSEINQVNGINQETALHAACTLGNIEIITELLKYNQIELNIYDLKGRTPLSILKASKRWNLVELLKDAGAVEDESDFQVRKKKKHNTTADIEMSEPNEMHLLPHL